MLSVLTPLLYSRLALLQCILYGNCFSLFKLEISMHFIAAVGNYRLFHKRTIIIYDRIRENLRLTGRLCRGGANSITQSLKEQS